MKGIIVADGCDGQLFPATLTVSKQLIPVYDKPLIYYPLSVLMLAGITDVLVVTTPADREQFERLLGDGSSWGLTITFAAQNPPQSLAGALLRAAGHIGVDTVAMILGGAIFHGPHLASLLLDEVKNVDGCVLFAHPESGPNARDVHTTGDERTPLTVTKIPSCVELERAPISLYLYSNDVIGMVQELALSTNGVPDIATLNRAYLHQGRARLIDMSRGCAWLSTGTHESMFEAGQYVRVMEKRRGTRIACLEEIALRMGLIDAEQCYRLGARLAKTSYGEYVMHIAEGAGSTGAEATAR